MQLRHKKDKTEKFGRAGPSSKSPNEKSLVKRLALVLLVIGALAFGTTALLPGAIDKVMEYKSDVRVVTVYVEFEGFEDYGGASVKEALTDGSKTYLLYPTFDSTSEALEYVRKESNEMLSALRSKYHMYIPLTCLTYKLFETLSTYLEGDPDCPSGYSSSDGYFVFQKFGDMYENDEENRSLKRLAFTKGLNEVKDGLVEYNGQKQYKPRR